MIIKKIDGYLVKGSICDLHIKYGILYSNVSKMNIKNNKVLIKRSLFDLIKQSIEDKKAKGYKLCNKCKKVYVENEICIYCKQDILE